MKRYLLFLTLFFTYLLALAQDSADKFTLHRFLQESDGMVSGIFSYTEVVGGDIRSTTFQIIKYTKTEGTYAPEPYSEFGATERVPENETLNSDTKFSFFIDGLDLTGNEIYKFAIKAIKELNNDATEEDLVFIYKDGNDYKFTSQEANATEFSFTYGLETPELSNKKSSSVTITWKSDCSWGKPAFYTIFGRNMDKPIATTSETTYFINNLISGYNYSFFIRAYDADGNYLSSSPDVLYTPERVDCITFPEVGVKGNTVTLTILGYDVDGPFQTDRSVYKLTNADEEVICNSINGEGEFQFNFKSIDFSQEFRLETEKIVGEEEIKAVGLFKLDSSGDLETQYCDIVFDLQVTHLTQYTATIEWTNPGFDAENAVLQVYNINIDPSLKYAPEQTINIPNPRGYKYSIGELEHSTNYKFILKLSDRYNNQAKDEVNVKTKVGSICGLEDITAASVLGCGDNGFIAPYDLEFYTEYDNNKKPVVTVRFRLNSAVEINKVSLYYTTDHGFISSILNMRSAEMHKGEDGWYSLSFSRLGYEDMVDDKGMRFAVVVTPSSRCHILSMFNYYATKFVSYKVGVGCQDDAVFQILEFEKLYDSQSQFTLQTSGRIASIGVFPEHGYNKSTDEFDLKTRLFYNNFDDAPSSFTLDISDPLKYPVGKYYLHIHDVYGEADGLKYLWAIY